MSDDSSPKWRIPFVAVPLPGLLGGHLCAFNVWVFAQWSGAQLELVTAFEAGACMGGIASIVLGVIALVQRSSVGHL